MIANPASVAMNGSTGALRRVPDRMKTGVARTIGTSHIASGTLRAAAVNAPPTASVRKTQKETMLRDDQEADSLRLEVSAANVDGVLNTESKCQGRPLLDPD